MVPALSVIKKMNDDKVDLTNDADVFALSLSVLVS